MTGSSVMSSSQPSFIRLCLNIVSWRRLHMSQRIIRREKKKQDKTAADACPSVMDLWQVIASLLVLSSFRLLTCQLRWRLVHVQEQTRQAGDSSTDPAPTRLPDQQEKKTVEPKKREKNPTYFSRTLKICCYNDDIFLTKKQYWWSYFTI